jgi:hypothetical protein
MYALFCVYATLFCVYATFINEAHGHYDLSIVLEWHINFLISDSILHILGPPLQYLHYVSINYIFNLHTV